MSDPTPEDHIEYTDQTPDDVTIHRLDRVYRAARDATHIEGHKKATNITTLRILSHEHGIAAILPAIRSGKIPLPEDVPQIAALRARVAVLEAVVADMNRRLAEACLSAPSAGHDLVDEACGLLRVARSQRDAAWASWGAERKLRHDAMPPLTTDEAT